MHVIEQYSFYFRKIEDEEVNKDQILLEKEAEVRWQNSVLLQWGNFYYCITALGQMIYVMLVIVKERWR